MEDKLENKDIEGDMHIQEIFFKYMNSIQPNLNYYDIALYMHEKYEVKIIIYSKTQFINYKNRNKKDMKYHEAREHMLDNIEFNKEKLLKFKLIYISKDKKNENIKNTIRIFGTDNSLELLNNANIDQYFIDGTYHCVPHSIDSVNVLITLIGYNKKYRQFELCLIVTFNNEKFENYKNLYSILKTQYKFKPKLITSDFCLSNIKEINDVFA